jgi:hypothetical protein
LLGFWADDTQFAIFFKIGYLQAVLLQRATPSHRHGEKKRIKMRNIETLTYIATCGQQDYFFSFVMRHLAPSPTSETCC